MSAGRSGRGSLHSQLTSTLIADASSRFQIDCDNAIDTESNLSTRVLEDILALLGLDDRPYLPKKMLIDTRLVAKRNNVAHGRYLDIDADDYESIHSEIVDLIEQFRNDVENAAVSSEYIRPSSQLIPSRGPDRNQHDSE